MAATPASGMPMLSGPPPLIMSSSCRQCGKDFNPLWRRAHSCGHCGYEYCSTCLSDGQAIMPRRGGSGTSSSNTPNGNGDANTNSKSRPSPLAELRGALGIGETSRGSNSPGGSGHGTSNGYDVESVCLPCLAMLQVTAAPIEILRSLPLKRLKEYLAAYDIPVLAVREKEDLVQAILKARNPATGCLAPENESYFRRRSVPKLGQIPSTAPPRRGAVPHPQPPPPTTNGTRAPPRSAPPRTTPLPSNPTPPPRTHGGQQTRTTPLTPVPPPATPRAPPPPVPSILSLVALPKSYLASLSIGTLKAILYENHVRVDFKQVLEKAELIDRVNELIVDERKRLERQRIEEERLTNPEPQITRHPSPASGSGDEQAGETEGAEKVKVPTGPLPEIERGLCVVCQDEEATLAVVDCGHLAMCAHCSELIMATSRECPLCRTRIVTPQRLIRIYRV